MLVVLFFNTQFVKGKDCTEEPVKHFFKLPCRAETELKNHHDRVKEVEFYDNYWIVQR